MSHLTWQKSSFSTGGEGNCVELAATGGHIHLRESDHPDQIATAVPRAVAGLLHAVKAGNLTR